VKAYLLSLTSIRFLFFPPGYRPPLTNLENDIVALSRFPDRVPFSQRVHVFFFFAAWRAANA